MMSLSAGALAAVQTLSQYIQVPERELKGWAKSTGIREADLSWLADVVQTLPLPRPARPGKAVVASCAFCGGDFEYWQVTRRRHYCSRSCQQKAYRQRFKEREILKTSRKRISKRHV